MLYCTATATSEPVSVPCEPGEEHPKLLKPWLDIWPASSTECSLAGRHGSIAAYRNMKTGARNASSPPYSSKPRLTDSGLSTFRTLPDAFMSRNFQRTQSSSWRDSIPVIRERLRCRNLLESASTVTWAEAAIIRRFSCASMMSSVVMPTSASKPTVLRKQ